jgi:hypothetical protein
MNQNPSSIESVDDAEVRESIRVMQKQRTTKMVGAMVGIVVGIAVLFTAAYLGFSRDTVPKTGNAASE